MATHKIVAEDTATSPQPQKKAKAAKAVSEQRPTRNPFVMLGRYFKGAWQELRQVRWPNRKATWSLTLAVIGFVIFFGLLITGLDALFKLLFQLILK